MRPLPLRNPPNPWHKEVVSYLEEAPRVELSVFEDQTRQILSDNDSPDLGFRYSVNPYRGCLHGCAYCYARPSHEYLGFGAGADFERKIVIKPRAGELLREAFEKPSWVGDLILFSGNTDCYQPLEASYRLTRACLDVCAEYRNPLHVITKSALVERDIDLLAELAELGAASVTITIPFWDPETARAIEPLVPTPKRRIEIVRRLSERKIPVSVNIAPLIPGLSDRDIVHVLEAAAEAGAIDAGLIPLRLPSSVKEVFIERIREAFPLRAEKILNRVRDMRDGELNDPRFGHRMRGEGPYFEAVQLLFEQTAKRLGLGSYDRREYDREAKARSTFRRPTDKGGQMRLFDR
ncbi:MAG TPA: PA0069 family radical SAM protein [Polyangiaceae bacterium]|jgi:DNA repair photolyase|nr:PA0069 family radical SAM protein [Polyangiaceae bacterium]